MSLVHLDPADRLAPSAPVPLAGEPLASPAVRAAPPLTPGVAALPPEEAPILERRLRAVPTGTEARGFALYVGLDEAKAAASGIDLGGLVAALKALTGELAPGAETYTTVALAPEGAGGRDVDVVRLALQDPAAVAKHRKQTEDDEEEARGGVIVDVSRKRVLIDDDAAGLTFKEFELLQYLVLREGRTIERTELISALWNSRHDDEVPNERTIDVHVRRLRAKLGQYEDVVRTVRGVGYRYDRHADVSVRHASAPSPDLL